MRKYRRHKSSEPLWPVVTIMIGYFAITILSFIFGGAWAKITSVNF